MISHILKDIYFWKKTCHSFLFPHAFNINIGSVYHTTIWHFDRTWFYKLMIFFAWSSYLEHTLVSSYLFKAMKTLKQSFEDDRCPIKKSKWSQSYRHTCLSIKVWCRKVTRVTFFIWFTSTWYNVQVLFRFRGKHKEFYTVTIFLYFRSTVPDVSH